ncbi:hypothetical protein [Paenibacillus turpanensis]|uniref:hypothetical protein n=1 Tax=Paenibacillus turpanensis TaxID=2689078 RepID=UPI00140BB2CD|nr:hypothetical protein [Paenibacillus turpanensis]
MNKHMDEKIIAMIREAEEEEGAAAAAAGDTAEATEEEKKTPMQQGLELVQQPFVQVGSELVPLEDRLILEDRVRIRMPKLFHIMPPEVAKIKYASERRPNLIYTDDSTSVNLAFTHSASLLNDEEMGQFTELIVQMLKRTQQGARWLGQGVIPVGGREVGYCACTLPVLDSDLYQLMFFISLEDRALLCTFNCLAKDRQKWEQLALGMMQTLRIMETREEDEG